MNISPIEEVKRNICGYKVQQFQGPVKDIVRPWI